MVRVLCELGDGDAVAVRNDLAARDLRCVRHGRSEVLVLDPLSDDLRRLVGLLGPAADYSGNGSGSAKEKSAETKSDETKAKTDESKAKTELAGGVPFISDADLKVTLDKAGVPVKTADAIVAENATARIDGLRSSLSVLAIIALIALPFTLRIPTEQPSTTPI